MSRTFRRTKNSGKHLKSWYVEKLDDLCIINNQLHEWWARGADYFVIYRKYVKSHNPEKHIKWKSARFHSDSLQMCSGITKYERFFQEKKFRRECEISVKKAVEFDLEDFPSYLKRYMF